MTKPANANSFFSWLGRQVGHVSKAVQRDAAPVVPPPKVIYRNDQVEERPVPDKPGMTLRRTTIDEVILAPQQKSLSDRRDEPSSAQ